MCATPPARQQERPGRLLGRRDVLIETKKLSGSYMCLSVFTRSYFAPYA